MTAKKCTKKRDARAKLLLCQSKPIVFLPFSLPSPSSSLKLPNIKLSPEGEVNSGGYINNSGGYINNKICNFYPQGRRRASPSLSYVISPLTSLAGKVQPSAKGTGEP